VTGTAKDFRTRISHGGTAAILILLLVLFPPISHAGGLGFAVAAMIVGITGYVAFILKPGPVRIPLVFWALLLFLIWAFLSSFWSPYEDPQILTNPIKTLIGVILYAGIFLWPGRMSPSLLQKTPFLIVFTALITLGLLLFDQITGYALANTIVPPGADEHPVHHNNTVYMNLSHSIAVLALLTPLIVTAFWRTGTKTGVVAAVIWIALLLASAVLGKLFVGLLSVMVLIGFMVIAKWRPVWSLNLVIGLALISILAAPFYGYMMKYATPELKAAVSASWEHRIEMWAYVAEMIAQHPIIGHGFDASRTFDETFHFRGYDNWSKVSLHPHNSGLQIWAETGAIGAALASAVLLALGRTLKPIIMGSQFAAISIIGFLGAALTICTFTFGVWQEWWWGILFLIGGFTSICYVNAK